MKDKCSTCNGTGGLEFEGYGHSHFAACPDCTPFDPLTRYEWLRNAMLDASGADFALFMRATRTTSNAKEFDAAIDACIRETNARAQQ